MVGVCSGGTADEFISGGCGVPVVMYMWMNLSATTICLFLSFMVRVVLLWTPEQSDIHTLWITIPPTYGSELINFPMGF